MTSPNLSMIVSRRSLSRLFSEPSDIRRSLAPMGIVSLPDMLGYAVLAFLVLGGEGRVPGGIGGVPLVLEVVFVSCNEDGAIEIDIRGRTWYVVGVSCS